MNQQLVDQYFKRLPEAAVRDLANLTYVVKKDTIHLANANTDGSFGTSDTLNAVKKTRKETNIRSWGKGQFGNKRAYLLGVRLCIPPFKADHTTPLTHADAINLTRAFCELKIDGHTVFECYGEDLPQGEGTFYQASAATAAAAPVLTTFCNGAPVVENRFIFDEPMAIENEEDFELTVNYAGGVTLSAACQLVAKFDAYAYKTPR